MGTYIELKIGPIDRSNKEDVSYFCFDQGCKGISETLSFKQKTLSYEPEIIESKSSYFSAYFETMPSENFFLHLNRKFPEANVEVNQEEEKDWLKIWKDNLKPFYFAAGYWVVPSWQEVPKQALKYLLIDPGMAFGTGTHETTRLAAEQFSKFADPAKLKNVLDVGMGTGILAFIAHKEGVEHVKGIDIDPECVRVAKENAQLNQISKVEFTSERLEKIDQVHDLVFANIVSGVLFALSKDLARVTKSKGLLILSGILLEEKEEFRQKFIQNSCWEELSCNDENDWTSFCLRKK